MLIWAIIASILLHILIALIVPNFKFEAIEELPQVLKIELQKPEPPPVAIPEPPPPEPPKPEPIKEAVKPKVIPKPIEKPIKKPEPLPQEALPPPPPPVVERVISIEPKPETRPEIIIPAQVEPPKPPEPTQFDIENALSEYGGQLGRAIAKHKSYPRIAQMRGWQGDVTLDLKIDANGNVLSAVVKSGSGYDVLDKQALEMVKKASPFPPPPPALSNRSFNISVPVSFKLENG